MKLKFLHPVAGLAYFEGDVADFTPAQVEKYNLVNGGHAIQVPETEGESNQLPDDLPARELLYENGLETIADVKNALPAITELNGIGNATAKKIKEYIDSVE